MIFQFFGWLFRTFTPYLIGVCIGIGFFFLLIRYISGPEGLVAVNKKFAAVEVLEVAKVNASSIENRSLPQPVVAVVPPVVENVVETVADPETNDLQDEVDVVVEAVDTDVVEAEAPDIAEDSLQESVAAEYSDSTSSNDSDEDLQAPELSAPSGDLMLEASTPAYEIDESVYSQNSNLLQDEARPAATVATTSDEEQPVDCGRPPRYPGPGPELNKFLACQWRNNCLASQAKAKAMLVHGRENCVMSGGNPVACRDYFDSLKGRYNPEVCSNPQAGYSARRW